MVEPQTQASLAHGPAKAFSLQLFAGLTLLVVPPILFALAYGLVYGVHYLSDRPTAIICGWLLVAVASIGGVGDVMHLLHSRSSSKTLIGLFAVPTLLLFAGASYIGMHMALQTLEKVV